MITAYVGLGSNLNDPVTQVRSALDELDALLRSRCLRHSSLYRSPPMVLPISQDERHPQQQPDYINAVAALETALEPADLLAELQHLEELHHRVRAERWGPRTLDLDLLLYGDQIIDTPKLKAPHPGLYERNFVLYPLSELAPDLVIPGKGSLGELLAHCERGSLERLKPVSKTQ